MSQIGKKYTLLLILCITAMIAIFGCGTRNQDSSFDPEGEGHPNDWVPARHATAALADLTECTQCHDDDFSAKTACTECHMESATVIHVGEWEDLVAVRHNGYVEDNGTAQCSNIYCHGETLAGIEFSGPSCSSCHLGGNDSFHPEDWEALAYARHAPYVKDNGNDSCSNIACHGSDLSGVSESGPSCSSCHIGGPDSYHPKEWGSNRHTEVGVVSNDVWFLDFNNSKLLDFPDDVQYEFGVSGGIPVSGDWNGDGKSEIGTFVGISWYLDLNGNGTWEAGTDTTFQFGIPGDIPVTGDWNGDGFTEIGIVRGYTWYLDFNGNRTWDPGTDHVFEFGISGDTPITGDWNGDGTTEIGVVRGNTWYLDFNGNLAWNPGTDYVFEFGSSGDTPITGDWNGDGITDIGIFNNGEWSIDSNGNGTYDSSSDETFTFGSSGDMPVTGDWNRNAFVKLHGLYVGARGGASCANAACHGSDFSGVLQSGPSCFICHGSSFPAP